MSKIIFFEDDGYLFTPMVVGREDGEWEVTVLFEKTIDHTRDRVPAIRHKLRTVFQSSEEAMQAGIDHGHACVKNGDVGLPKGSTLEPLAEQGAHA
ncbi:hypothetical protein ACO0LO_18030 [Undibacterium sp. TJN25]|uniref:hypothetical protein n=1 Tax=Undibacterium sp. TJN25 TaxID=3413056 RepID=UPI003BF3061C